MTDMAPIVIEMIQSVIENMFGILAELLITALQVFFPNTEEYTEAYGLFGAILTLLIFLLFIQALIYVYIRIFSHKQVEWGELNQLPDNSEELEK